MINKDKLPQVAILTEQFIPDHVFFYVITGAITCYDGNQTYTLKPGDYYIARKNRLVRYKIPDGSDALTFVLFCFDEEFLVDFQKRHSPAPMDHSLENTFIKLEENQLLFEFIRSLKPYYNDSGEIDKAFEDVKYEELLIILLRTKPELSGLFFDFGAPQKINLEEFMTKNFSFNVSIERFALLTGRSLSGFKRDFKNVFHDTPARWLVERRLREAYFLIDEEKKKPSDIYLDLGFETLSHFSFAFKKLFGITASELGRKR